MGFINVIFRNIIGYDGLVFLLMFGNIAVFLTAKKHIWALYDAMHRRVYAPAVQEGVVEMKEDLKGLGEKQVDDMRAMAVKFYTLYGTITGIFPLLGILGTVVSLLGMVQAGTDITGGFFAALTSTFWGLVFAIAFKFMDSFLSPKLEESERAAEVFLQRKAEKDARVKKETT